MKTTDFTLINGNLQQVYDAAADISKHHEFMPGYLPSEIETEYPDGSLLVERKAEIRGKLTSWKSRAWFEEKRIRYTQIEGKLKGMEVVWLFEVSGPGVTRVTITHDFRIGIPLLGRLLEKKIAKPAVDKTTSGVLAGLKRYMETS